MLAARGHTPGGVTDHAPDVTKVRAGSAADERTADRT